MESCTKYSGTEEKITSEFGWEVQEDVIESLSWDLADE